MAKYKVLIVEDDPMVAMINEKYVQRNGQFEVVKKCPNGQSALDYLAENEADLVIMDVYMPVMSGIETLRAMREDGLSVAVIMVTAANDGHTLEQVFSLGVVDYLVKPFAFDRFQTALEKFIVQTDAFKQDSFSQKRIDSLLGGGAPQAAAEVLHPKGIQEKTLETLQEYMQQNRGRWLAADEITETVGLSAVTVRRYMNYMAEAGMVEKEINYGTGGRPSTLYRKE